jgi:hypothetical protein
MAFQGCFCQTEFGGHTDAGITYAGRGEDSHAALFKDPSMVQRFKDILELPDEDRTALLRNLDAFLRDAKARMAYQ